MHDKFEKVFEEDKRIAISWRVEPTFTKIRKRRTTKYFDKLNSNEYLILMLNNILKYKFSIVLWI